MRSPPPVTDRREAVREAVSIVTAAVRYRVPDRNQVSAVSLDEQLPDDHPVRLIWEFVTRLELSAFVRPSKAVVGHPGAEVIPATLLFALWLFALTEGIGSARRLAKLCKRDLPYQWLCGGRPVNYHTLADFYAQHGFAVRDVFVEHIAALRQQELIDLWQVTLDGRKVRANAASDSFHREPTLQAHLAEARAHLERLTAEAADATLNAGQAAAQQRAARARQQRLAAAVTQVQQRQQQRQEAKRNDRDPAESRASETDSDAAKMKMSDGGYRPAYNVETVTDAPSGLIVTVAVTNQGSDNGQLRPMLEQMQQQQDTLPLSVLCDSGFADQADLESLESQEVEVLMPPRDAKKDQQAGRDPYARKRRDSDVVAQWRERMGTEVAQKQYRRRAAVAEGVHAQQSNRGWRRFRLRGLAKVQTEAWWQALTHNVVRLLAWGMDLAGTVRAAAA
jgi:transposase